MRVRHGEQDLERAQAPHAQLPVVAGRGQPAVPEHDHRSDARAVLCRPAGIQSVLNVPTGEPNRCKVLTDALSRQQKGRASGICFLT